MNDPPEGSSSLFESVLSGISEEQWEQYKNERKLESDFVVEEDDYDEIFLEDSRSNSPIDIDTETLEYEVIPNADEDVSQYEQEVLAVQESQTWGGDAAVRYVNGELTFNELAEIMENSTEDDAVEMEQESMKEKTEEKPKKIRKVRKRDYDLPKELQGLMGTANLSFANGDKEDAIKICLAILQRAPAAQAVYQLLGVIYEEMGNANKSLQCYLLASYLNPSDTEEWIRLAQLSLEQSEIHQAIKCYTFAIRNDPSNINFLWERCNLYELVDDRRNALAGYELILKNLSNPEDGPKCVNIAREIAKLHHESEDYVNAIKILETAFSKFPHLVTSEDVNLLLELQITQKCYKAGTKNFIQHCGVCLKIGDQAISTHDDMNEFTDEQMQSITECIVPDVLPIDLQVKLLVCLIHVRALEACQVLLESLKKESPEDLGDLYLDVAEAFVDIDGYSEAMPLLLSLVNSKNYNLAAVWLKLGDCFTRLDRGKEAREAYHTVIEMAPSHQEARISLSRLLIECGKKQEAVKALKQEYESGKQDAVVDFQVLLDRCNLLYELGYFEEFVDAAHLSLYSHCYCIKTQDEIYATLNNQSYRSRHEALKDMPSMLNRLKPVFMNTDSTVSVLYDLFVKLCKKLFEFKRFEQLQTVCLTALTSNVFRKCPQTTQDVDIFALLSCIYNDSHRYAYILIKDTINKNINNNRSWNLLCYNVVRSQEIRHNRFCLRHIMKNPDHLALGLFNGHNAMNSGSYKLALGEYMNILKRRPDDSSILFYVGITYIHMASQKFSTKRYLLIIQGIHFLLRYIELEKESQESLYNMGRAMHQLGIKDAAVQYYKKALDAQPAVTKNANLGTFDLRHEIAFNLSLIYQGSGASHLSSMYLRTYNVV